jgi:hypothetical protein
VAVFFFGFSPCKGREPGNRTCILNFAQALERFPLTACGQKQAPAGGAYAKRLFILCEAVFSFLFNMCLGLDG